MPKRKLLSEKLVPKRVLAKNKKSIKAYKQYDDIRKQMDIIDQVRGKQKTYKVVTGSTKNIKISNNGGKSTKNLSINSGLV